MTDDILSIALVLAVLAGGTAAIGSELIGSRGPVPAQAAVATVTLPTIVVTGRRLAPTVVASEGVVVQPQRLQ